MENNFIKTAFQIFILIFGIFMVIKHRLAGRKVFLFWQRAESLSLQRYIVATGIFSLLVGIFLFYTFLKSNQKISFMGHLVFLLLGGLLLIFNKILAIKIVEECKRYSEKHFQLLYLICSITAIIWSLWELGLKNFLKKFI